MPPVLTSEERISVLKTCFDRLYNAAVNVGGDVSPEESTRDVNDCVDVMWSEHMAVILSHLSKYLDTIDTMHVNGNR